MHTSVFSYCPVLRRCAPPPPETLCFSSCLFKGPPYPVSSDWSTHAPSIANNNRAAVLNQFLGAKLGARHKLCTGVTPWHGAMSQSHGVKGSTTDEAFQEQCFLWEGGASVGVDFECFDFQDSEGEEINKKA